MEAKNRSRNDFWEDVYAIVQAVPVGRVTTYGAIARALGVGGSARMVGWALNNVHATGRPIPAHRVVNRNGMLTGKVHFAEPDLMQRLLEAEGVQVIEDRVLNFEQLLWTPQELENNEPGKRIE